MREGLTCVEQTYLRDCVQGDIRQHSRWDFKACSFTEPIEKGLGEPRESQFHQDRREWEECPTDFLLTNLS